MKKQIIILTVVLFACAAIADAHVTLRVRTPRGRKPTSGPYTVHLTGIDRLIAGDGAFALSRRQVLSKEQIKAIRKATEAAQTKHGNPIRANEQPAEAARQKYDAKTPKARFRPATNAELSRASYTSRLREQWRKTQPGMPTENVEIVEGPIKDMQPAPLLELRTPPNLFQPGMGGVEVSVPNGRGGFTTHRLQPYGKVEP